MNQKKELIASIDIGSSKIKCLITKLKNNKIEILGKSIVASKGIDKGLVTNFHDANLAVREFEFDIGQTHSLVDGDHHDPLVLTSPTGERFHIAVAVA